MPSSFCPLLDVHQIFTSGLSESTHVSVYKMVVCPRDSSVVYYSALGFHDNPGKKRILGAGMMAQQIKTFVLKFDDVDPWNKNSG